MSIQTETYDSLKRHAEAAMADGRKLAYACSCKKCGIFLTKPTTPDVWLQTAYDHNGQTDLLTQKEFRKLNHEICQKHLALRATNENKGK